MSLGVSVILPTFNGVHFLSESIASVVAQTLRPRQLIIVDDGSTDGSQALLNGLDLPFETIVLHQSNKGQSAARNLAASRASGQIFAFLDHDDIWHPEHLEILVGMLDGDVNAGWAYCNLDEIGHDARLVHLGFIRTLNPRAEHPKASIYNMLASDMFVFPSATIVRREAFEAVGGFDTRLAGYEDDDLFLRLFCAGWTSCYTERSLVRYRRHTGSSVFSERQWSSREIFARKLMDMFPDDPDLARFFIRDLIAPRFYRNGVEEYLRHLARGRYDLCIRALDLIRQFSPLTQPRAHRRVKRWLLFAAMAHPPVFRRFGTLLRNSRHFV